MSKTYTNHWNALMSAPGTQAIDVIASMKEATLNEFLKSHFKNDNKHYTLPVKRTFDANGKPRTFWLTVIVEEPVVIGFPPFQTNKVSTLFQSMTAAKWTELDQPPIVHRIPREKDSVPNIRIGCPKMSFLLEWEKLDGSGKWDLKIDAIEAIAEGFLEVVPKPEGSTIKLHPTKVFFDKADSNFSTTLTKALQGADPALLASTDEKFRDLVVILLNVAATQATPNFIREIPIPTATIKDKNVTLSYLSLENDILTIGATLDAASMRDEASRLYSRTMGHFNVLIEEDIEEAGGMEAFFDSKQAILPQAEIDKKLVRTMALIRRLESESNVAMTKPDAVDASALGTKVPDGMAIGMNEYFLDTLANAALPDPTSECTEWKEFLGVRGRACWWSRIANADTSITDTGSGFRLAGSVGIDIGGALDGCVKKFWDCSWKWACERFGLALRDRPEVAIELIDDGKGILLVARIVRMPKLEADLPFPFDKVVEFFGAVIIKALQVVLNLILSRIKVRIVPEDIAIPVEGHQTGLRLSDFDAFYFKRSDAPFGGKAPANKLVFGAYAVSVEPRKI